LLKGKAATVAGFRALGAPLVAVSAALLCVGCSGSVKDLEEHHAAKDPAPPSVHDGGKLVLLSPRHRGAFTFTGGVRQAFTDSGAYVEMGQLGARTRLWIPVVAIKGCSRTQWGGGVWDTNLWVEDSQVLISFPDSDDRLVQWCKDHGLTVFDRATQSKWLNER
jgi:hypothetical protein